MKIRDFFRKKPEEKKAMDLYSLDHSEDSRLKVEITSLKNTLDGMGLGELLYNPDEVLHLAPQKLHTFSNTRGLQYYQILLERDAQVYSCVQTRISQLLKMKWEIIPVGNSERDREIFDFVQSIFLGFENFHQDMRELMDALAKGFAVSEILYKNDNNLIKPFKLLSRDQTHFAFDIEGQLRWITKKGGDNHKGERLPQNKFLIHRHNPRAENPYGSSILGPRVFWASWYKLNLIKYWVQYCERFAQPMPIGTFPKHWSAQQQKQFLDAISRMYSHKSIVCEEGTEVNLFETKGTGIDVLKQATAYLDHQISLAILGQSSTTNDDPLGSYAKNKVAKEISDDIIESDAIELASTFNKYIKIWVDLNFKNITQYPTFVFQNRENKDLQALSQVYKTLTEMGIEIDKEHIAKTFDLSIPS